MKRHYFVGVKKSNNYTHCDIFRSNRVPTESTHGSKYAFAWGGYRALRDAVKVAMYHNYGIDTPQGKSILFD